MGPFRKPKKAPHVQCIILNCFPYTLRASVRGSSGVDSTIGLNIIVFRLNYSFFCAARTLEAPEPECHRASAIKVEAMPKSSALAPPTSNRVWGPYPPPGKRGHSPSDLGVRSWRREERGRFCPPPWRHSSWQASNTSVYKQWQGLAAVIHWQCKQCALANA